MSRVRSSQRVWRMNNFCFDPYVVKHHDFHNFEKKRLEPQNHPKHTHLNLWKNTGPSQASLHVTRSAVVSRVIRVQRRYAVRIRPIQSMGLANFGQILWIIYWAVQKLYTFFLHRIRLEDSFGQNIINFHKIWAEYGPFKGFGSCTILDPDLLKNHDFP